MSGDDDAVWYHLPADLRALTDLRHALLDHLGERVTNGRLEPFVLAIHEAAASIIQHSAHEADQAVAVTVYTGADVVDVTVAAARPWRASLEATDGLSYQLMLDGSDQVTFSATDDRSSVELLLHTGPATTRRAALRHRAKPKGPERGHSREVAPSWDAPRPQPAAHGRSAPHHGPVAPTRLPPSS